MILQAKRIKRLFFQGNYLLIIYLTFFSCSSQEEKAQDMATTGQVEVKTDEVFFPVISAQKYIFESIYKQAEVLLTTATESEVINSFVNGDAKMIVTGRMLSKEEIAFVAKKNYSVYQTKIGIDAVALIVNKKFPDSTLTLAQFKSILNGTITNWHDIHSSLPKEKIVLVFDQSNSSNVLYINDRFPIKTDSISLVVAGSVPKVIDFVKNNNYSIGIIGWSWISDEEDPKMVRLMNEISMVGLGTDKTFYEPGIGEVNDSLYPFIRPIFSVNKGARAGLGSGFSTFMASDRGQRIILKSGIVPATVPGREIELK